MMNATNNRSSPQKATMQQDTAQSTMGNAFGHSKTLGEVSMNKTKRSHAETIESNKKKISEDDEAEGAPKSRKLGLPVPRPGVNSSSFLAINRNNVPEVISIVSLIYFEIIVHSTHRKMARTFKVDIDRSFTALKNVLLR
jgi:hypothetical protein